MSFRGSGAGSVYVFVRSGGVWTEQAKLTASDAATSDYFGRSVFVSGDTAMIWASGDDHAGGTDAGSAYVFDLNCVTPGDLDGDGDVDVADYLLLVDCFVGPFVSGGADRDGDGDVDLADYAAWDPCLTGPGVAAGAGCEGMDLDPDGDVDVGDFAVFQTSYTGPAGLLPPGCQPADLDGDKDVDVADFAAFQEAFAGP